LKEKFKKSILDTLLVILIASSNNIIVYYTFAVKIGALRVLPTSFLLVVIVYILAQLGKRYFEHKTPWYNWLYYIGLAAIILPLPLFSMKGDWIFPISRYGSFFLLIPPLIEFIMIIRAHKKEKNTTLPNEQSELENPKD
jgi:hypothetical protein